MLDVRLFHSPGPAAANALSRKVLYVHVTTHVRFSVEPRQTNRYDGEMPDNDRWTMSQSNISEFPERRMTLSHVKIADNWKRRSLDNQHDHTIHVGNLRWS